MRNCLNVVYILVLLTTLSACVSEPNFPPPGLGCETGMFRGTIILNEGTFGNNEASIDFVYGNEDSLRCQNAFEVINGQPLGDVAQEGLLIDQKLYIAVNNSHLIHEIDANSLVSIRTLSLPSSLRSSPRSLTLVQNEKMYVSSLLDSGVYAIDRDQLMVSKKIFLGNYPEGMAQSERFCFVALGNYIGSNQAKLAVIEIETDIVVTTLPLPLANPGPVVMLGDQVWVACRGDFFANEAKAGLVGLSAIDFSLISTIPMEGNLQNEMVISGTQAFVLRDSSIAKINLEDGSVDADWVKRESLTQNRFTYPYSLSLNKREGLLYVGMAHGLGANGEVIVLDPFGVVTRRIPAGRFPGQVIFNP